MLRKGTLSAFGLGLLLVLVLAPLAGAQGVTVQVADHPELGRILTDGEGMTLYLFTNDEENVTNCYDQCAVNWPPLLVGEGEEPVAGDGLTGELGVIDRTDGGRQVTYNGIPLYYWINDNAPGDATGQGVGDVWFVLDADTTAEALTTGGQAAAQATATPEAATDATVTPEAATDETATPAAAAQATATDESPEVLPETGGPSLPWPAILLAVGGLALLAGGLRLALSRR